MPENEQVLCPECQKQMEFIQVGMTGNFLLNTDLRYSEFWGCKDCFVVNAVSCSEAYGEQAWMEQKAEDESMGLSLRNRVEEFFDQAYGQTPVDLNRRKNRKRRKDG